MDQRASRLAEAWLNGYSNRVIIGHTAWAGLGGRIPRLRRPFFDDPLHAPSFRPARSNRDTGKPVGGQFTTERCDHRLIARQQPKTPLPAVVPHRIRYYLPDDDLRSRIFFQPQPASFLKAAGWPALPPGRSRPPHLRLQRPSIDRKAVKPRRRAARRCVSSVAN